MRFKLKTPINSIFIPISFSRAFTLFFIVLFLSHGVTNDIWLKDRCYQKLILSINNTNLQ